MKTSRWLGLLFCSFLAGPAGAAEWNLVRFESREYVTLDNIAEFYGFPKPPPVDLTGHSVAAPSVAAPLLPTAAPAAAPQPGAAAAITTIQKNPDEPSPISSPEPPAAVAGSGTIVLDSGKAQLAVTVGLREQSRSTA